MGQAQCLLRPLAIRDVLKNGDEATVSQAIGRYRKPKPQRLEVDLEFLRAAGGRNAAIDVEQLRGLLFDSRDDLRRSLADHVLQAGQSSEGVVDGQIDEILRMAVFVEKHPAIGEPVEHVLEQRAILGLALDSASSACLPSVTSCP